jgi:copper resistance protein D
LDALIPAARAAHFLCALLMFGELVFARAIASPPRSPGAEAARELSPRALRILSWSLMVSVVSAVAWLAAEAAAMSGLPIGQALGRDTMQLVLGETTFGRVWLVRFFLAVAFAIVLFALGKAQSPRRALRLSAIATVIAAAYLCALAWSGHAGAAAGTQRRVHLLSDMVHLLAAGAWLGALPALVRLLGSSPPLDDALHTVRRFSTLGLTAVGALIATGAINAWFLVGSIPALFVTEYGRLLLAKLVLFAAMVSLAAVNRLALTPRLARQESGAMRSLHRNAMLETALGIVVVSIVAVLGITIPAAHRVEASPVAPSLHDEHEHSHGAEPDAHTH